MDAVNMTKKGKNIHLGNGFVDLVVYLHGIGADRCLEVCHSYLLHVYLSRQCFLPPPLGGEAFLASGRGKIVWTKK